MSLDNAKLFIKKVTAKDEAVLALLPQGFNLSAVKAEDFVVIAAEAAKDADWDFTADELQEAYMASLELDDEELASVAGGCSSAYALGPGGCSSNYFWENCAATVETGSGCVNDDYCDGTFELYTQPGGCDCGFRNAWGECLNNSTRDSHSDIGACVHIG